jgi:hypothetical protein
MLKRITLIAICGAEGGPNFFHAQTFTTIADCKPMEEMSCPCLELIVAPPFPWLPVQIVSCTITLLFVL